MPDLIHSLQTRDIGHMRIVAGLWGIELEATELDIALEELATSLLDPDLVREVVDALPADARAALDALAAAPEGRLAWVVFARRFGEVRDVGAARRDRDQIYLSPVSAAEALFYRAFLARAFFDTSNGLQEFAYIPEDFIPLVRPLAPVEEETANPAADATAETSTDGLFPEIAAPGGSPSKIVLVPPTVVKGGEEPLG